MKGISSVLCAVVALGFLAVTTTAREDRAVRTIAKILLTFHHAPSSADTAALRQIQDGEATTDREGIVAAALMRVCHVPQADDRRMLKEVIADQSTPSSLRTVATAILNLTHTVTDADRRALEALLK